MVEPDLESGGHLVSLEYRLKDDDRLKEKIAEQLEDKPDDAVASIVARIPHAIRYTFQFSPESYVRGLLRGQGTDGGTGYEQVKFKNLWNDPEYKGVNTRWVTPEGQRAIADETLLADMQWHRSGTIVVWEAASIRTSSSRSRRSGSSPRATGSGNAGGPPVC